MADEPDITTHHQPGPDEQRSLTQAALQFAQDLKQVEIGATATYLGNAAYDKIGKKKDGDK